MGFININFMKKWNSKNFEWFSEHYNITKDNPRYRLLKEAYRYGELQDENFSRRRYRDAYVDVFNEMSEYLNHIESDFRL